MSHERSMLSAVNLEKAVSILIEEIKTEDFSKETLLKSKLSMSLTLINMAIKSIPRLIKLFEFSQAAEDKIFSLDTVATTTDSLELMELYKLSVDRQNNVTAFINSILNGVRWTDLESALLIVAAKAEISQIDSKSSAMASTIIKEMHELRSKGLIPST